MRIPLELHFLERECQTTKTLLRSSVVKTIGKWHYLLQHANKTLHELARRFGSGNICFAKAREQTR